MKSSRRFFVLSASMVWLGMAAALHAEEASMPASAPYVMFNYDGGYFWIWPDYPMTEAGARKVIEVYENTPVTHLMMCTGGQMLSYESERFSKLSDITDEQLEAAKQNKALWSERHAGRVRNHRLLAERGVDPFTVWIDEARRRGIALWLSRRMNDLHFVHDYDHPVHSRFWKDRSRWADPSGTSWRKYLDFGRAEVREWAFDVLREHLERYDPDGLELDFVRGPFYFRMDQAEQGKTVMTEFIRDVRELTEEGSQKRGHTIELGVRVGTRPELVEVLGLLPAAWAQEGLIDQIVLSPFYNSNDMDIPVEAWEARMGPEARARIRLVCACDVNLQAYKQDMKYRKTFVRPDLAAQVGFAAAALHRGADGTYWMNYEAPPKFNRMGGALVDLPYPEFVRTIGQSAEELARYPRRIVVTWPDVVPENRRAPQQLPQTVTPGTPVSVELYTGPAPAEGDAVEVYALATNADGKTPDSVAVTAQINGGKPVRGKAAAYRENALHIGRAVSFPFSAGALAEGRNEVSFASAAADAAPVELRWIEIGITPAPRENP
ncbi:MAG: hypothetical protein JW951_03660 [Lentisphaerae bacterium]|nr:hypothetical protein [Lentisphaerota bacterium]